MANEIGFSTIYPSSGLGSAGPIGATGATGANQSVRGSTGATGVDSNYITSVLVNQETGRVEFGLSDGTNVTPGILQGATGIYAGVTASSLGSGISLLKGVCGGITLDFYNFRTAGLLGITYSTDGALVFTISANSGAGGISPSIENNRIVYAQSQTTIMSTDMIPEASNGTNRVGANNYGYVNFGGETAGRNIVANITDSSLSVGPIERGEFIVNLSDFYITGVEGITLDVSRATVYNLVTPLGIKAFTTSNITSIPPGQIMSVTLIVHGEDIWNFPEDVVFDAESKPIFYPGVNILHMWKTNTDENWRASFTARGIGAFDIKNPGVRGSCCYFDIDGTKHCDDYVTQTYCKERSGNFEALVPCDKNSCLLGTETSDGICCTEGRCVSDLDPSLCQIIGGYFISGITCGQYGKFPDDDADNRGKPLEEPVVLSGICFNTCKPSTICCKDGTCLGQLTRAHCDLLEGTTVEANDCNSAKCCDHIIAPGACCTQTADGYECTNVDTPYACNTTAGGIYMGKNTKCPVIATDTDICCTVANRLTCYECTTTTTGSCNCGSVSVNGTSCQDEGYFESSTCDGICVSKTCFKCNGTNCDQVITDCGVLCPVGYEEGSCTPDPCQTKKCYKPCVSAPCEEAIFPVPITGSTDCRDIGGDYLNNRCDDCPPPVEPEYAACFWCFPHVGTASGSTPTASLPTPNEAGWLAKSQDTAQAPFRSVFSITKTKADALDAATIIPTDAIVIDVGVGITLPAGLDSAGYRVYRQSGELYYTESNLASFGSSQIGTDVAEPLRNSGTPATRFKCYYVGSYEQNANPIQNRINCLTRYGYTTPAEQADCQLCDPIVNDITYQTTSDLNSTRTLDKIEPYQARIKAGLHAPFPPIWGRITYVYGKFGCNGGGFKKQTTNLRLLSFIERKTMMDSFRASTGKYWLQDFLNRYDNTNTTTSVLNQMLLAVEGSINSLYNVPGKILYNQQPGPETCLVLEDQTIDKLAYDPQRLGGNFFYGANYENYRMYNCEQCEYGWILPGPSDRNLIAVNGVANNPTLANSSYYPAKDTLNTLGERYFVLVGAAEANYVRGIFGRNLRYNLDSFRSSTVFYNTDGSKTMNTSDSIAIPISYVDGYGTQETPCNPANGIGGGGTFCQDNGGDCPPCECLTCGTNPNNCSTLCNNTGDPSGGDADAWSLQAGLIAPSTVTPPATPFKVQVKKSQITTNRVYIAPGICVDMLCPDCYSYESC